MIGSDRLAVNCYGVDSRARLATAPSLAALTCIFTGVTLDLDGNGDLWLVVWFFPGLNAFHPVSGFGVGFPAGSRAELIDIRLG